MKFPVGHDKAMLAKAFLLSKFNNSSANAVVGNENLAAVRDVDFASKSDGGEAARFKSHNADNGLAEARRLVEALAQALYEQGDPAGTPWAKQPLIVREAWLVRAERQ